VTVSVSGKDTTLVLKRQGEDGVFLQYLSPGSYVVTVTPAKDFEQYRREIEVRDVVLMVTVYLGKEGWPAFHMGPALVPFRPLFDRLAIGFVGPFWRNPTDIFQFITALDHLGLVPYYPDAADDRSFVGAQGTVLFLRSKPRGRPLFATSASAVHDPDQEGLFAGLRGLFPQDKYKRIRIAVPLSSKSRRVKLLDSQFAFEFAPHMTPAWIKDFASAWGAEAEPVPFLTPYWRWRFKAESNYLKNLSIVDFLTRNGTLISGEPDLFVELTNHGCDAPKSDPWYSCQEYISDQGVDAAWLSLSGNCGSSDVVVAMIDEGVNRSTVAAQSHPDIDPASVVCVDLQNLVAPPAGVSAPPTDCSGPLTYAHGMGVFGIIGALHNDHAVAGIAPGAKHVAIHKNASMSICAYCAMLKWVAGLDNAMPLDSNDDEITVDALPPASIINCSHGIEDLPTPCSLQDTYERLAQNGRTGKGTVVVYSAGQGNGTGGKGADVQGVLIAAGSPYTLIVTNTAKLAGKEVYDPTANYGRRVDLCALGGLNKLRFKGSTYKSPAPSLHVDNRQGPNSQCKQAASTGVLFFDRTSAAAPMVSGVAALILSINANNQQLYWYQLRAILQASARKLNPSTSDAAGRWKQRTSSGWQVPTDGSVPSMGLDWRSDWYGYGRLDAAQAVIAPTPSPISPVVHS